MLSVHSHHHHCFVSGWLLFFLLSQSVPVSSNDTCEVSEESIKPECDENAPEDVLFLSVGPETSHLCAKVDSCVLVPDHEINNIPDS